MQITALLGDYPAGAALKSGAVRPEGLEVAFREGAPARHFRGFLERLDTDISEIAIMTHLIGHEAGVDSALLPAVVLTRAQHPYLVHDPARGLTGPEGLAGKRVVIRSWTVTTATWIREVLDRDHGVPADSIEWITLEEPHLAGFRNPPNLRRAPAGSTPEGLLAAGEAEAAVLGAVPTEGPLVSLIPQPEAAGADWAAREGAIMINHMIAVPRAFAAKHPEAVRAYLAALAESDARTPPGKPRFVLGRAAIEPSLKRAIACAGRQGILTGPVTPDTLYAGNGLD